MSHFPFPIPVIRSPPLHAVPGSASYQAAQDYYPTDNSPSGPRPARRASRSPKFYLLSCRTTGSRPSKENSGFPSAENPGTQWMGEVPPERRRGGEHSRIPYPT
jgi:hypothetical protein